MTPELPLVTTKRKYSHQPCLLYARHLVTAAALPEASFVGGSAVSSVSVLGSDGRALVSSCRAAGEEHNESGEEEKNHGSEESPHADIKLGAASALIIIFVVDVVL